MLKNKLLESVQFLLMFCIKRIGCIKNAKVPIDAFILNKCIIEVPFNRRVLKIIGINPETIKRGFAIAVLLLQFCEIRFIQNHAL